MKKNSAIVLYVVIILVILGGLALFIFRGSILTVLRQKTGVDSAARVTDISTTVVAIASSSALDVGILSLPRFTSLVNQVADFNFDNICWRPDSASQSILAAAGAATSSEEIFVLHCAQGNNAPFNVKKK